VMHSAFKVLSNIFNLDCLSGELGGALTSSMQAQSEAVIDPHGRLDDLGREAKAPVRVWRCRHAPQPATARPELPT
jgi:hypothetical protein